MTFYKKKFKKNSENKLREYISFGPELIPAPSKDRRQRGFLTVAAWLVSPSNIIKTEFGKNVQNIFSRKGEIKMFS